jgi:hypothetical protein
VLASVPVRLRCVRCVPASIPLLNSLMRIAGLMSESLMGCKGDTGPATERRMLASPGCVPWCAACRLSIVLCVAWEQMWRVMTCEVRPIKFVRKHK